MSQTTSTHDGRFFENADDFIAFLDGTTRGLKFAAAERLADMPEEARQVAECLANGGVLVVHPDDAGALSSAEARHSAGFYGAEVRLSEKCPRGRMMAIGKERGVYYGGIK